LAAAGAHRQPKGWDGLPLTSQGKAQTNARLAAAEYNHSSLVAKGDAALKSHQARMNKGSQPIASR